MEAIHSIPAKAWEQRSRCLDFARSAMAGTVEGRQAEEITAPRRGHEIWVWMELPELHSRELKYLYHIIYIIIYIYHIYIYFLFPGTFVFFSFFAEVG